MSKIFKIGDKVRARVMLTSNGYTDFIGNIIECHHGAYKVYWRSKSNDDESFEINFYERELILFSDIKCPDYL